eukprot:contig_28447_g6996
MSQRYRRDIMQVDPPKEPISDTEFFLAILVLVPEAVGIAVLLLQPRSQHQRPRSRWYWREALALVLTAAAAVTTLIGVWYVDLQEREGHEWRAGVVRYSRRIPANETEDALFNNDEIDYRGRNVIDNETLILVARLGYRPHLTRRLSVGFTTVFIILVLAVAGKKAA